MKIKKVFLAGLLNVIFPGLGALYVGNWKRALFNIFIAVLFVIAFVKGAPVAQKALAGLLPLPTYIIPGLIVLIYVYIEFSEGQLVCKLHNNRVRTQDWQQEGKR